MKKIRSLPHKLKLLCVSALLLGSIKVHAVRNVNISEDWTTNDNIAETVVVKPGATLTIKANVIIDIVGDLNVRPGAHLVLESGAQLKVRDAITIEADYTNANSPANGATLIANNATFGPSSSADHWLGIQVWGLGNGYLQANSGFASALLTQCTVTKAHVGIADFKNPYSQSTLYSPNVGDKGEAAGGRIRATQCLIKDNFLSVYFKEYGYKQSNGQLIQNTNSFNRCQFVAQNHTTPPWPTGAYEHHMAYSVRDNVWFRGCEFINSGDNYLRGAIYAHESGVAVARFCSGSATGGSILGAGCSGTTYSSSFLNIKSGVVVYLNNFRPVQIENVVFTQVRYPVKLTGVTYPVIYNNTMDYDANGSDEVFMTGVELAGCTGFRVESNDITVTDYPGATYLRSSEFSRPHFAIGVLVADAGQNYNDIFKNTFTGTDYGIQAVGNNRTDPASHSIRTGLTLLCNTFNDETTMFNYNVASTRHEWPIQNSPGPLTTGLAENQFQMLNGNVYAAGNYFDAVTWSTLPAPIRQFYKDPGISIQKYYYGNGHAREEPRYTNIGPSNKISAFGANCTSRFAIQPITYPTALSNLGTLESAIAPMIGNFPDEGYETEVSALLGNYRQAIDGGVLTFMFRDTVIIDLDSVQRLMGETDYLYDYHIIKAMALSAQNLYDDAIDVLEDIGTNFTLQTYEQDRVDNLVTMYELAKDLYMNDYDWANVDGGLKSSATTIAANDDGYARYIARSYLSSYEGATFDDLSIWINPTSEILSMSPDPVSTETDVDIAYEARGTTSPQISLTPIGGGTPDVHNITAVNSSLPVDLEAYVPGTYVVKLIDNGNVVDEEELVVNRVPFEANAGDDDMIDLGNPVTLEAEDVGEAADYNWYDDQDNLLYTGRVYMFYPTVTATYKLEVVATLDNFTDEDFVQVVVKPFFITTVAPNPATTTVAVSYQTTGATTASLVITPVGGGTPDVHPITPGASTYHVSLTGYTPGNYVITLVCDSNDEDEEGLVVTAP